MNKNDNPFYNLAENLKNMSNKEVENICIGIVTNESPLLIIGNGLQLDSEDLVLNKQLSGVIKKGDRVIMLTQDNQKFFVICVLED